MSQVTITLPDGASRAVPSGTPVVDVARAISPRLAKAGLAAASVRNVTSESAEALPLYRHSAAHLLAAAGLRVEVDARVEKIGYKIREAQLQKVPSMLVLGDREMADGTVAVRSRTAGDLGARAVTDFVATALSDIARKGHASEVAAA